jgi:c-di-GMP-binding flagellar brake protein YcgR
MVPIEKRRNPRIDTLIVTDVSAKLNSIVTRGCIVDLSKGGMKIETNENLDKVSYVHLTFTLPDGQIIKELRAKIVRKIKSALTYTYGIQFRDINIFDLLKITRFINNYKRYANLKKVYESI